MRTSLGYGTNINAGKPVVWPNTWSIAETRALTAMLNAKADKSTIYLAFPHRTPLDVNDKARRLIKQGFADWRRDWMGRAA